MRDFKAAGSDSGPAFVSLPVQFYLAWSQAIFVKEKKTTTKTKQDKQTKKRTKKKIRNSKKHPILVVRW